MKKIVALLVALCMMLTMLPAVAENTVGNEEDGGFAALLGTILNGLGQSAGEEEAAQGEESGDMSALLGTLMNSFGEAAEGEEGLDLSALLGGFLGGTGEAAEGEESFDLSALLGGFLGGMGEAAEGEESFDLSALLGGFLGGTGEAAEGEEDLDLSALLALLGSLGAGEEEVKGGEPADPGEETNSFLALFTEPIARPENAINAESVEQFFGTWKLHKVHLDNFEIPFEELTEEEATFVIAENEFAGLTGVTMELVDGALNVIMDGDTFTVYLTDDDELVLGFGMITFCYTRVTE